MIIALFTEEESEAQRPPVTWLWLKKKKNSTKPKYKKHEEKKAMSIIMRLHKTNH